MEQVGTAPKMPVAYRIGFVVASKRLNSDPYIASLTEAMSHASQRANVGLALMLHGPSFLDDDDDWTVDPLVDGLVLSGSALGPQTSRLLKVYNKPTVLLGSSHNRGHRDDIQSTLPLIDVEKLESSASVVDHLVATGCERIAMISGPTDHAGSQDRLAGFRLAHRRRGLGVQETLVLAGDFTRDSGYRIARELLALGADAIFAANDEMAQGAALAASESGIAVPTDLSIAGFDGIGASIDEPQLTTAEQPFDTLAATAIAAILELIKGGQVPERQLIAPRLRLGWSTHAVASRNERAADA